MQILIKLEHTDAAFIGRWGRMNNAPRCPLPGIHEHVLSWKNFVDRVWVTDLKIRRLSWLISQELQWVGWREDGGRGP